MAQLNLTLNQDEILLLLSNNRSDAFKNLLQESLNGILKSESAAQLKAEPYERSEERTGSRNGFRDRPLTTRIGTIVLKVPKHRDGEPFKTMIFDNYCRSEAALIVAMAEMVVNGVSTRKVSQVMEVLCGKTYSKSTVSEACKVLDEQVRKFRERPLTGEYPFLTLDATYFKVRELGRVVSKSFMIAYATDRDGVREIIGFSIYPKESKDTWNDFLKDLNHRGLKGVRVVTSDAHEGIIDAISKKLPGAAWQRCQFHFTRNILDKTPKKYQQGLANELHELWQYKDIREARKRRDAIIDDYKEVAEAAMNCLDEGFESAMTVMLLPVHFRRYFRTSNHIERLNKELKRRSKAIGIFPNEVSLMRIMGSVLIERNELIQGGRRVFTAITYRELMSSDVSGKLLEVAEEQRRMLAA